jgi:ferric-dicitrate binding protein FerR (iron transport regulator)
VKENPSFNENKQLENAYRISRLIAGYIQGTLSTKEHDELDEWVAASDENMKLFEELTDEAHIEKTMEWYRQIDTEAALKKVRERIGLKSYFPGRRFLLYAAMMVSIIGAGLFIYYNKGTKPTTVIVKSDIEPGSNKAVLTLGDGRKIVLDSAGRGMVGGQTNVMQDGGVIKYDSGQLAVGSKEMVYNTISVPRGGQFKIILSDGSAVWLNSESSLKFPVVFVNEREVELEGEGYFEVVPHSRPLSRGLMPPSAKGEGKGEPDSKAGKGGSPRDKLSFSVNINGARVEVLGTHFNVNSYHNEEGSKVTLIEGKVRVRSEQSAVSGQQSAAGSQKSAISNQQSAISGQQELRPGEGAVIGRDGTIKVAKVNTEEAVSWTKGRFYFKDATIKNIMQQLERWYDIEVVYDDFIFYHFNAPDISRGLPLSKVLKVLQMTRRVQFVVEGKKVRVKAP